MTRTMLLIGALALAGTACVFEIPPSWVHAEHLTWDGREVEEDDGILTVDGVELNHSRWVTVTGRLDEASASSLELRTATGTIDVVSSGDASYELDVDLHSEMEGDGEVFLEQGRLIAKSVGDYMLFINEIRGRAPDGVDLRVESGMGMVEVRGFSGGHEIRLDTGSGDARASACKVSTLRVDADMGEVLLDEVVGHGLELDVGMGNANIHASAFEWVNGDLGMGNASIHDSTIRSLVVDLSMGNLRLVDTQVTRLEGDCGMGHVILEGNSPRPEIMDLDMGVGNIVLR